MFKLTQSPAYWWPVELLTVSPEGQVGSTEIEVQYARLTEPELEALHAQVRELRLGDDVVAERLMRNWRKVGDDDTEMPFTPENCARFLGVPGTGSAVVAAFYQSRSQAALGNLKRLREAGATATPAGATAQPPTKH